MTARPTRRDRRLLLQYGITSAEAERVLRHQGGRCAICLKPPVRIRLSLDHEHATGVLRGILCMSCNKAIQMLRDDAIACARAARYLMRHPATVALGRQALGRPGRVRRKWRTRRERRERMAYVAGLLRERFPEGGRAV